MSPTAIIIGVVAYAIIAYWMLTWLRYNDERIF